MDYRSEWIWKANLEGWDLYCDFLDHFTFEEGNATVRISADTNYALFVNGVLVQSGQYADFPYDKVYDEFDITQYCRKGKNVIAVTVWYYGKGSLCYYTGNPALRYEVWCCDQLAAYSGEHVKCRQSREYRSGLCKEITDQMGFSFHYDITGDDGWRLGETAGFENAVKVMQELPMRKRPVKKLVIGEAVPYRTLKADQGTYFLLDLGREEVGYLTLRLVSSCKQKLLIAYGEHIHDGCVRRLIGGRDFSVEVTVREGENVYRNPYRRLGLRYLEIFAEAPIRPECISVVPVSYPLNMVGKMPEDELDRRIYEVCVRTLELCMHEHYEDCPWREQALYCMDSRNQMLCGYYCFGEYEFARACLKLMSMDRRKDGILSICFPSSEYFTKNGLAIPSFSLHYFTQMREYYNCSGDTTLLREAFPKMKEIIQTFINRITDGYVPSFSGLEYWNYYEWSDGLEGKLEHIDPERPEAALNCLLIIALRNMAAMAKAIGEPDQYSYRIPELIRGTRKHFLEEQTGLFYNRKEDGRVSELVNSLAILAGVCSRDEEQMIAEKLTDPQSELTPVTLSMLCFKYDALLKVDREGYRDYILTQIREKYRRMLDAGATTFWETEDSDEFKGAESLCHGWSALPIYYYEVFGGQKAVSALYEE